MDLIMKPLLTPINFQQKDGMAPKMHPRLTAIMTPSVSSWFRWSLQFSRSQKTPRSGEEGDSPWCPTCVHPSLQMEVGDNVQLGGVLSKSDLSRSQLVTFGLVLEWWLRQERVLGSSGECIMLFLFTICARDMLYEDPRYLDYQNKISEEPALT